MKVLQSDVKKLSSQHRVQPLIKTPNWTTDFIFEAQHEIQM